MPKRIPLQTIILQRDGEKVVPQLNKPFDFTDAELASVTRLNPDAIGKIITADESGNTLVTKTQAEIDADIKAAVAEALAKVATPASTDAKAETTTTGAKDS